MTQKIFEVWALVFLLLALPDDSVACDFEAGIHFTRPWNNAVLPANGVVYGDLFSHGAPTLDDLDVVFETEDEVHPVAVRLYLNSNDSHATLAEMTMPVSAAGHRGVLRIVHVDGSQDGSQHAFEVSTEPDTEPPVLTGDVELSFPEYEGPDECCGIPLVGDVHRITATFAAAEDNQDVTEYLLYEHSSRGDRLIGHHNGHPRDEQITISEGVVRQEAECYKVIALDHAGNRSAPIGNCETTPPPPEEPLPNEPEPSEPPPASEPPSSPAPGMLSLEDGRGCSCIPRTPARTWGIFFLWAGLFIRRRFR